MKRLPRRICACGCGVLCKKAHHRYASPACAKEARVAGGRKGGKTRTVNYWARVVGDFVLRVKRDQVLTRGDLLELTRQAYQRGWMNGYTTSEHKWRTRAEQRIA